MEIKDKPSTMSVREWITKKVGIGIMIPENVIRQVISHQFDTAHEALNVHNSLEISGFGKFYYNVKKADKEIEKCVAQKLAWEKVVECETTTEKERQSYMKRLTNLEKKYKGLIRKKYGDS